MRQIHTLIELSQALMRMLVFHLLRRKVEYRAYTQPQRVGYYGWWHLPRFGTVAFEQLDGRKCFRW